MLKFEFTTDELNLIKSKIHFTPRQIRIIDYRMDEIPIVQMAQKESCDVSTMFFQQKVDIKSRFLMFVFMLLYIR